MDIKWMSCRTTGGHPSPVYNLHFIINLILLRLYCTCLQCVVRDWNDSRLFATLPVMCSNWIFPKLYISCEIWVWCRKQISCVFVAFSNIYVSLDIVWKTLCQHLQAEDFQDGIKISEMVLTVVLTFILY